jgi:hypothetical protein
MFDSFFKGMYTAMIESFHSEIPRFEVGRAPVRDLVLEGIRLKQHISDV